MRRPRRVVGTAVGTLVVLLGVAPSAGALELRQALGSPYGMRFGEPQTVAIGDFNGVGLSALAVGTWSHSPSYTVGTGGVSLLLGQRVGGFVTAPQAIALGQGGVSVTAADFNGDGRSDLTAVNDGKLSVFRSDGSGQLTAAAGSIDAPRALRIVAGHLNGDAKPDLVAVNSDDTLSVFLGGGDGQFAAASGSPIALGGDSAASVAIGDFNGDRRADLAVTDSARGTVTVLLGNGDGTFAPAAGSPFAAGTTPDAIAVGNFNGDGRQDLALTSAGGVPLFLGRGDGTFAPAAPAVPLGPVAAELVVGDFNDDGWPDLAASGDWSHPNGALRLLLGDGSGAFRAVPVSPPGIEVQHVLAGGQLDGRTGLVVSRLGLGGNRLSVLLAPLRSDPPSARLVPHPSRVLPGSPVQLDASASTDPLDRAIVDYRWLIGRATRAGDSRRRPKISETFAGPGVARVRVQVVNADGGAATATTRVRVLVPTAPRVRRLLYGELAPPQGPASRLASRHGYSLAFPAPGAGRLRIRWYVAGGSNHARIVVAEGARTFAAAGGARVRVELTADGRALLRRGGSVRLVARGVLARQGRHPVTVARTVRLAR